MPNGEWAQIFDQSPGKLIVSVFGVIFLPNPEISGGFSTVRGLLYDLYELRLQRALRGAPIPCHVAVILDGNRRWARAVGSAPSVGHQAGANRIGEFLEWADEVGVEVVTLWMLSTDNLSRDPKELRELLLIITSTVTELADTQKWRLSVVGDLNHFPADVAEKLRAAVDSTRDLSALQVNVAVGYGGRAELVDAVRELLVDADNAGKSLAEVAQNLCADDITARLYTRGQPDPDLVIRTSGEQRLSGFMLWQSAHSEFYFCETYWPDFRKVDFLRALRSFAQRERRHGK